MSKILQPAKPKPFLESDEEGLGLLCTKLQHLPTEQGNPWKHSRLVTTVENSQPTMEGLEHGLHSRAARKRRIQCSTSSGRLPNEDAILSTLYCSSRWKKDVSNVDQRTIQTPRTARNNSVRSRAAILLGILETRLRMIGNRMKTVNGISSSRRQRN
jgi:hypothetical protein